VPYIIRACVRARVRGRVHTQCHTKISANMRFTEERSFFLKIFRIARAPAARGLLASHARRRVHVALDGVD
jgi:hypothetical protein